MTGDHAPPWGMPRPNRIARWRYRLGRIGRRRLCAWCLGRACPYCDHRGWLPDTGGSHTDQ